MKRFYKLTALNTAKEIGDINLKMDNKNYNPFDFSEFTDCLEDFKNTDIFDINDNESIFILREDMLGKLVAYLTKFGYDIKVCDATNDMFYGKFEVPNELKEVVSDYLAKEYSTNDVLDKMLEGVGLSDIDKIIIQKNS